MVLPSRLVAHRHRILLALALTAGSLLPALVAALSGNLSIPHNDAWSYSRIARTFAETGHIELLDWNRSALIGQFIPLGPLASSLVVQQLYVAALALVMLLAAYDLLRPLLGRDRAAFAVLVLSIWPGLGLLSTSFMLDVPALAATLGSLALARRAWTRGSFPLLALAMLVAFWGLTIRAQSLAAPAAMGLVLIVEYWRERKAGRPHRFRMVPVIALYGVFAATGLAFTLWMGSLPNNDAPVINLPPHMLHLVEKISVETYFLLALALAPAVILAARPRSWGWASWAAAAVVAVVGALKLHHFNPATVFTPGNYLSPNGPYSGVSVFDYERVVFSHSTWHLILVASWLSGILMAGVLVHNWRRLDLWNGSFLVIALLGNAATPLTGQSIFDRYWIAVVPGLLGLILARPAAVPSPEPVPAESVSAESVSVPTELVSTESVPAAAPAKSTDFWLVPRRLAACVALLVCAGLSFAVTANGFAFDAARWRTGNQFVAAGVPARHIDAGLEWVGYHSVDGVGARYDISGMVRDPSEMFPSSTSCYVASPGRAERTGWVLQEVVTYQTFLVIGRSKLYVYFTGLPGCGTAIY